MHEFKERMEKEGENTSNLNITRLILHLSLLNPMKSGIKSRMMM